jgi:hypothetical protein
MADHEGSMTSNDPKLQQPAPADDDFVALPVPPEAMHRYMSERDPHAERDIVHYVELESDETVQHAEKVKVEYVAGDAYEIWDVITDKNRWWVITNPTNLYPQKDFPNFDYVLSFHIGLMMRVQSRSQSTKAPSPHPLNAVARRHEQAEQLHDRAIEPEDYQAIGMRLRECLLVLSSVMQQQVQLPTNVDTPQAANFIAWSELLLNALCPGEQNKTLRQYLKSHSDKTWQLVNWLTHSKNADKVASRIALTATGNVMAHFVYLERRETEDDAQTQCPVCSSRNIRSHYSDTTSGFYETCATCGWNSHPHQAPIWLPLMKRVIGLIRRIKPPRERK